MRKLTIFAAGIIVAATVLLSTGIAAGEPPQGQSSVEEQVILNYNRNYQVVVTDSGARLTSPTAEVVAAVNITLDTSRKINASTELTITSDCRKKDEIRYDVEKYFPVFDRLKPCSFVRKNGGNQRHLGFIAQEYMEAEAAAGISASDSVIISETDGYYGLSYGEAVPLLVAKVQELDNRVKELESWKS